jgi:hypothetical protein
MAACVSFNEERNSNVLVLAGQLPVHLVGLHVNIRLGLGVQAILVRWPNFFSTLTM